MENILEKIQDISVKIDDENSKRIRKDIKLESNKKSNQTSKEFSYQNKNNNINIDDRKKNIEQEIKTNSPYKIGKSKNIINFKKDEIKNINKFKNN